MVVAECILGLVVPSGADVLPTLEVQHLSAPTGPHTH